MKILVLGAGVVGVATAYYLWKDGHEVTVIDRQSGPGMETSFGNAGGICPSFAGPWAAPGMIAKVLKLSLQPGSPIRYSPRLDPRQISWALQWMRNCNPQRFRANKLRMQRVAHYSYRCLREIAAEAPIRDFDFHRGGVLQIFRTQAEMDMGRLSAKALDEFGVPWHLLDAHQLTTVEPAMAHSHAHIAGALHMPADASGDSYKFVGQLEAFLKQRGVSFLYDMRIDAMEQENGEIRRVRTSGGPVQADTYVMALGSYAPLLTAPLGLKLPVYPLKGYSVTIPVTQPDRVPTMSVMDEHNKVMISRLGNRIRAAGMAELGGYGLELNPSHKDLLLRVVGDLFPAGLDMSNASFWAGLRPMTPDGPPILGRTRWPNLFLNSGHGSNGWTQSCGTAKIVADLIAGRVPEIDIEGLTLQRFSK